LNLIGGFRGLILRLHNIYIVILLVGLSVAPALAQATATPTATPSPTPAEAAKPSPSPTPNLTKEEVEALRVVESTILVYSSFSGRGGLDRIGKTTVETGKIAYLDAAGSKNEADFTRRVLRGESLDAAKIRLDQKFSNANYAMVYDGAKVFGVFNQQVFQPRADAIASFSNRVWHGLDALLRYRANKSKIVYDRDEKIMGVNFFVIKLKDKADRETEYFISKKSFRVMMLKYEANGIKYRRKFYNHNYAQQVLIPYRTVLWADDKMIEERTTQTITFGQDFGEEYFQFG